MFFFEKAKPCIYSSFIVKNLPISIFFSNAQTLILSRIANRERI